MQQPGVNGQSESYRYGFQGQEHDDEITGTQSHYAYEYRMNDARLGRFLSLDPLSAKYPYNSPYAFSENSVIAFVELEGLEKSEPILFNYSSKWSYEGTYWIQRPFIWIGNVGVSTWNGVKAIPNGVAYVGVSFYNGKTFTEVGSEFIADFSGYAEHTDPVSMSEDIVGGVLVGKGIKTVAPKVTPKVSPKTTVSTEVTVMEEAPKTVETPPVANKTSPSATTSVPIISRATILENPSIIFNLTPEQISQAFQNLGYEVTPSAKKSGNGVRLLVKGGPINSVRISTADSYHKVPNILFGTDSGKIRIVNGSRDQYFGNIAEEEAAGTTLIFLK